MQVEKMLNNTNDRNFHDRYLGKFKGYFQTLLKDKNAFQVLIFDRPEQRD